MKSWTEAQELYSIANLAFHEAAHIAVSRHYGSECCLHMNYRPDNGTYSAFVKVDRVNPRLEPFQMAVIAWAGIIAEWKLESGKAWQRTLPALFKECKSGRAVPSSQGDSSIICLHKKPRRTFNASAQLVDKLWPRIRAEAHVIIMTTMCRQQIGLHHLASL